MSSVYTHCLPLCNKDFVSLVGRASAKRDAGDPVPGGKCLENYVCFPFLDRNALQHSCRVSNCYFLLPVLTWRQDLRVSATDQPSDRELAQA